MLFVAGHGVRDLASGSYYFLPYPATADNLLTDGLRMSDFDEMLRVVRRNVRAVVVMLDTCHAGALGIPASAPSSADEMARQMSAGEGFFLLAATKPGEESKEQTGARPRRLHLCGARGPAAAAPTPTATAPLSVSELFGYVARRVPQPHPAAASIPTTRWRAPTWSSLRSAGGARHGRRRRPPPPLARRRAAGAAGRQHHRRAWSSRTCARTPTYDWISKALRLAFNTELSKVQALRVYSPELIDRTAARARHRSAHHRARARHRPAAHRLLLRQRQDAAHRRAHRRRAHRRQRGLGQRRGRARPSSSTCRRSWCSACCAACASQVSPEEGAVDRDARPTPTSTPIACCSRPRASSSRRRAPSARSRKPGSRTLGARRACCDASPALVAGAGRAPPSVPPARSRPQVRAAARSATAARCERKDLDERGGALRRRSPTRQRDALRTYLDNANDLDRRDRRRHASRRTSDDVAVSFTRRDRFIDAESGRPVRLEVRLTKVLVREQSTWKIGSGQ